MYHQYSAESLEKKAEKILTSYKDGQLLRSPQAMDVDDFAEFYCKAVIDFANLSQDGQILGCACFNDGFWNVWNEDRTKQVPIKVCKGCILVDNALIDNEVEGRLRFTIIHECSHLILHPRFYYKKPNTLHKELNCSASQIESWAKCRPKTDDDIREWQANRLGAALIMPAQTVKMLMAEKLNIGVPALTSVCLSDVFTQEMADVFRVSNTAMRYRLRDINLLLH